MRQFKTIFGFEMKYYLKNKIFVGVTVFLLIAIAGIMFFPRVSMLFRLQESENESADRARLYLSVNAQLDAEMLENIFAESFPEYEISRVEKSDADMKKVILEDEGSCGIMIKEATDITYYVNNLSLYDSNVYTAEAAMQKYYQMEAMLEKGFSAKEVGDIFAVQIHSEIEKIGTDQSQNFFYTYIMIFALYMVLLLYGQMVATNVATEKSSRAMEVLITSAKPVSMLFGKVLASCLAGLVQLLAVFGSAILFYQMNRSYWGDNPIIASIFAMPPQLFGYMLIFFVLGFLIYAFLYGAIGSTASKVEDINTSVMPITLVFVAAFMVVILSMTSGNVDTLLMRICSYIPLTSPMAMFTRIAMSIVPWYEIVVSVGILVIAVAGIGVLAAKIYRVGVLLYGSTPKLKDIVKALKNA
ncbi:MAG: ABC transporter permease [Eubacteriales bacterium]|nr:ABC transporter permease [Eubacteriales bacterium]